MNIAAAGFNADSPHDAECVLTERLIFRIGKGLNRSDGNGIARMHAHRVKVFNAANDNGVVRLIAHNFQFDFFPAEHGFFNQNLADGRCFDTALGDFLKFFNIVSDTAAGAAQGIGRTDDDREADFFYCVHGLFKRGRKGAFRQIKPDGFHGFTEFLAVFRKFDGLWLRPDNFHVVFFQNTHMVQIHEQIESRLPSQCGQNGIGTFLYNDFSRHELIHGLDICCVAKSRICHNSSRVRVQQDNAAPFLFQCFQPLCARIIKFCRLSDHNRTGTKHHNRFQIFTLRHFFKILLSRYYQ